MNKVIVSVGVAATCLCSGALAEDLTSTTFATNVEMIAPPSELESLGLTASPFSYSDAIQKLEGTSSPSAQADIAAYLSVWGVTPEAKSAGVSLLTDFASQGNAAASYRLGNLYDAGLGVGQDASAALGYYTAAATAGNPQAMWTLGRAYLNGNGVDANFKTAVDLLKESFEAGNVNASIDLARAYQRGWGVGADTNMAESLWQTAVTTKRPDAFQGYADFLLEHPTATTSTDASNLLLDAAKTGDRGSQRLYADYMLSRGQPDVALAWLRLLDGNGDAFAKARLADLTLAGTGVPKDPQKALELYSVAAEGGDDYAKARLGALLAVPPPDSGFAPPNEEQIKVGISWLNEAAATGQPAALFALAGLQHKDGNDGLSAFSLAAAADSLSGGLYATEFHDYKMQVCTQGVDVECAPVPIFFVTNRIPLAGGTGFSNQMEADGSLHFGVALVNIPLPAARAAEQRGLLANLSAWVGAHIPFIGSTPSPAADPTVTGVQQWPGSAEHFLSEVKQFGDQNKMPHALIFIHGFANTFEAAATQLALISEEDKFPGVPILFDWASAGSLLSTQADAAGESSVAYTTDSHTADESCPSYQSMLRSSLSVFGKDNVTVLAHSMGGGLLYAMLTGCPNAVSTWAPQDAVGSIIFAAPDVAADTFGRSIAAIEGLTSRITLYVSANDLALRTAKKIWGGKRAGQGGDNRLLFNGVYTIDASTVENSAGSDLVNHGYVFQVPQTKIDLAELLRGKISPDERDCPAPYTDKTTNLKYWIIRPDCTM